jgi:hypothetical protein
VLEERNLLYFSKRDSDKPKGVIRMVAGTDVVIEEKYSKPFCFTLVKPNEKFILQAANEDECVRKRAGSAAKERTRPLVRLRHHLPSTFPPAPALPSRRLFRLCDWIEAIQNNLKICKAGGDDDG